MTRTRYSAARGLKPSPDSRLTAEATKATQRMSGSECVYDVQNKFENSRV